MPKKNCLNCIAYCNMLADGKCGLGFEVEEVTVKSHAQSPGFVSADLLIPFPHGSAI